MVARMMTMKGDTPRITFHCHHLATIALLYLLPDLALYISFKL
jgi:hypothetical protein